MEISFQTESALKSELLVHEAKKWLKFTESGGNNRGQVVEAFQKAVDGRAHGEPWCMSFVQYVTRQVDVLADVIMQTTSHKRSKIYSTEHCMTCWNKSPKECRIDQPVPGAVVIWQKGTSSSGHTGIVVSIDKDDHDYMWTIEGNTGPSERVEREGDGVYLKKRHIRQTGNMRVRGFLRPWA